MVHRNISQSLQELKSQTYHSQSSLVMLGLLECCGLACRPSHWSQLRGCAGKDKEEKVKDYEQGSRWSLMMRKGRV